jgi:hypothetical protein
MPARAVAQRSERKGKDHLQFVKISLGAKREPAHSKNDGCIILWIDKIRLLSAIHQEIAERQECQN